MYRFLALLALVGFVAVGCGDDEPNGPDPNDNAPKIRLLHAVYDGGGLDLRVDDQIVHTNIKFLESSGYKGTLNGSRNVSVHLTGQTQVLKLATRTLSDGAYYTMYCYPPQSAFAAQVSSDELQAAPENARIKFVNASYAPAPKLEEYAVMITGNKTLLHNYIRRTESTLYTDVVAGTYSFTLKLKEDTSFTRTYQLVNLDPGSAYTIVLHGTRDDADAYPLALRMYKDNGSKTDVVDFVEVPTANLQFLQTIAGTGLVDVAVDGGSPQIKGMRFADASGYRFFGVGEHAYTVSSGTTPLLVAQPLTIQAGKNYTSILVGDGNLNTVEALNLEDVVVPNPSQSLVRFVHTASDAPAINVVTELAPGSDYPIPGMQGIPYKGVGQSSTTGSQFLVIPPGTYNIRFFDAVGDSVLTRENGMTFGAGKIYTLWYGGRKANATLKGRLLTHN